ncbi:MAG: hypothetical protein HGA53_10260 [Anaerolineaceae bacterium]|nr:hypothetical protein [Anaerolineaceae bacterium]
MRSGEMQTLLGWLDILPNEQFVQQPELLFYKILAQIFSGKTMNAVELISRLENNPGRSLSTPQSGRLQAMKAWLALASGREEAYAISKLALAALAEDDLIFRAVAVIVYATECQRFENMQTSIDAFRKAYLVNLETGQTFAAMTLLTNLAFKLHEKGRLREAEALCREAVLKYTDPRGRLLPVVGIVFIVLATIVYEKGDLDAAELYARQGSEICSRLFSRAILGGDDDLILSQIAFERGKTAEALQLIHSARQYAEQVGVAYVPVKMILQEIHFRVWMGDADAAEAQVLAIEELARTKFPNVADGALRSRARLLILQGRAAEALPILHDLEEHARVSECDRKLINTLISRALAYVQLGDNERMRTDLSEAVRLAAPEGYRRIFVREGWPLARLLEQVRGAAPNFVEEILAAIPAQEKPVQAGATRSAEELIEPLSEQETVILGLLGEGCSNQEIGSRLFISAGTAKWHVHNLLAKLGAKNRTEAVHRGRELGLLPK